MYNAQAGRFLSAPRQVLPIASISILILLILGGLFYALLNWPDRPADPDTAFAAAFDGLREVDSLHFSVEESRTGGLGSYRFTNLGILDIEIAEHYFPADREAFEAQTEEDCLVRDGDYRYCIIRKLGTGEEVGRIEWGYGMRTTSEGAVVRPNSVHYRESWQPDRDLRISGQRDAIEMELLYLDGVTWSKTVDGDPYWHMVSAGQLTSPGSDLYSWGLLDAQSSDLYFSGLPNASSQGMQSLSDRYDSVERLQDTEIGGILVERYLASSGEGSEVLEIWIGKEDGLVRRIDKRMSLGSGSDAISSERTYTFSRFNEQVEIPRPWPCFGAPNC